jgi:methionine synthase I (cobalamin-dependent)
MFKKQKNITKHKKRKNHEKHQKKNNPCQNRTKPDKIGQIHQNQTKYKIKKFYI